MIFWTARFMDIAYVYTLVRSLLGYKTVEENVPELKD